MNEEFLEGPTSEFEMQGRETYWQASGEYFLYWCARFFKWRIAGISAFSRNKDGECFAYVSDMYPHRDIQNSSFLTGFIEVQNGAWKQQPDAGVRHLGTLSEQMSAVETTEEIE